MFKFLKERIQKYIGSSNYKRNVLVMVGGRVTAQVIPILLTPLLTRIYSPSEFGIFAAFSAIVTFISMISSGRYCLSIILPKEKEKAQVLVIISSFFTIAVSTLFLIIILLLGDTFFHSLNIESVNKYAYLLVLSIMFIGLQEPLFYYGLREKKYKELAINAIVQALILVSVRLFMGYLGYTTVGLIFSYFIGSLSGYILLLFRFRFKLDIEFIKSNFVLLITKYSNFPRYSLLSDSIYVLGNASPNILINKLFGNVSAGYFSISDKILGSPIWFITSSVGDVFKQEVAEQYRNGKSCKTVFEKTCKTLFLIGFFPFLIIFIVAPYIVPILFGDMWAASGEYIRIFSLMYFSSFIVNPVSYIIYVINKQKYGILYQSIKLASIILAFGVGYYLRDIKIVLIMWSVLVTLANIIILLISYKLAKESKYVEEIN